MGVDIDILEHCKKVRADHGPPYTCPVDKCGRSYKTVCGLQYHLKVSISVFPANLGNTDQHLVEASPLKAP